ncbi:CehA/McbA family metallohydrolase [bacterium]|nr:CehA/McbA family metallohydrolase [candidate division CSSED10-310 bacterium]
MKNAVTPLCWLLAVGITLAHGHARPMAESEPGLFDVCRDPDGGAAIMYEGVLGRGPTTDELQVMRKSGMPPQLFMQLLDSDEFAARMQEDVFICYVYWHFLQRDPAGCERHAWTQHISASGRRSDLIMAVAGSGEFRIRLARAPLGKEIFRFDPTLFEGYDHLTAYDCRGIPEPIMPLARHSPNGGMETSPLPVEPFTYVGGETLFTPYGLFRGYVHSHTAFSDGQGHASEAYEMARDEAEMDFLAVTDHGELLVPWEWEELRWVADMYTEPGVFAAFRGFEYTNIIFGHLNVLNSVDYTNMIFNPTLEMFYGWLALHPDTVATFNHPGEYNYLGMEFLHFTLVPVVQPMIMGIEVVRNSGFEDYAVGFGGELSFFEEANLYGWRVGALSAQDNHQKDWGIKNDVRTVVLAEELSRTAILDGYRARRFYASEDRNLNLLFQAAGEEMGAELPAGPVEFMLSVEDPDGETFTRLEAFRDGVLIREADIDALTGTWSFTVDADADNHFYHVWVEQADGDAAHSSAICVAGTDPSPPPTPGPGSCAFSFACRGTDLEQRLDSLYRLRHCAMAAGPRGEELVTRFYMHGPELIRMMSADPGLTARFRELIATAVRLSESHGTVTREHIRQVEQVAGMLFPAAGAPLHRDLDLFLRLLRKIEDRSVDEIPVIMLEIE